jgi:hypothetical protein
MRRFLTIVAIAVLAISCNQAWRGTSSDDGKEAYDRGIYHWKTTFDLSEEDTEFMALHNIDRLYVRMFDVGVERNESNDSLEVVPLGTTRFCSKIPDGYSFIPTVFITQDALKAYNKREFELASLIVRRVNAMSSWNELGSFDEMQYDCDWTASTRESFERLCESTKRLLQDEKVILSGTIRLHQLEEATYPFDRGVLMIYNTGSFVNPNTTNSILDYDDVSKYLSSEQRIGKFIKARKNNCVKIDIAYPTFSWGVLFDNNKQFKRLIKDIGGYSPAKDEQIRIEKSDYKEINRVKSLVDSVLAPAINGNIIYHLDSNNLKNYSREEIENIYN